MNNEQVEQIYRDMTGPDGRKAKALFTAGCRPVYRALCGGFTWIVPSDFSPAWLYSDRSCGYYSENPREATLKCYLSATFQKVLAWSLGRSDILESCDCPPTYPERLTEDQARYRGELARQVSGGANVPFSLFL